MSADAHCDAPLRLLELLADGAPVSELATVDAPPEARELAMRIGNHRQAHRHREAALTALLDTARELASESDPAYVLEAIVRRARHLLQTDLAYLTLYDPEVGDTSMRTTAGSVSALFQSVRLPLGAGLGGLVASTHKPYWTADYPVDQRFSHTREIDKAVAEEGIVAICGTPLVVDGEFVGVLFAANRTPRRFSRDEVALLANLATLAAVTILQTRARADAESALRSLSEAHETVRRHTADLERAAAAHDRFASLVLEGGGVDDITAALSQLLGGWAVLLDDAGGCRSAHGPAPLGARESLAAVAASGTLDAGRLVEVGEVHAVAVTAARERLGTLVVGGTPHLADADQRTVERAAVVTALVLLFERTANEAHQSARNRLVSDLVSARGSVEDRLAMARAAGFDPQRPFCLLVLRGHEHATARSVLLAAGTATGDGSIVGAHDGDIVALVPGTEPDRLAKSVAARLGRRGLVTVAGVGPMSDVGQLPASLQEGTRTVAALVALGHRGTGAAATELGFAGLIVGSQPDVSDYVRRVLGPVLAYDERRGTELLETLSAYFAAGSSPRHTATALHVHVNTVSQRLERLSALLGPDWQRPAAALEIQLALRLRRLLRPA